MGQAGTGGDVGRVAGGDVVDNLDVMGGARDKLERAATWEESREVTSSTALTSWVGLGSSWESGEVGRDAGGDVVDNLDVMLLGMVRSDASLKSCGSLVSVQ